MSSTPISFNQRIQAWQAQGKLISALSDQELETLAAKAEYYNPWFTKPSVEKALKGVAAMLEETVMQQWLAAYQIPQQTEAKSVALVLAGNIPLVGFHDILVASLMGHKVLAKLSSQDEVLPKWIVSELAQVAPDLAANIQFVTKLEGYDAVIATGSNNSSRYFEYYFSKVPHIIRKNRHSAAVLTGSESEEQLIALGQDVFSYYGHGCRNVSRFFLPAGYDIPKLLDLWHDHYHEIVFHNKYANNYSYNRAVYLLNQMPFLDTGYVILREHTDLHSPLSVVNYTYYQDLAEVEAWVQQNNEGLQCLVAETEKPLGMKLVPFGQAQNPMPWDYADGVDTVAFLLAI